MRRMTNVGAADAAIRVVLGLVLLSAILVLDGRERRLGLLGLLGLLPLLTAAVRICPLYSILGIETCPAPEND